MSRILFFVAALAACGRSAEPEHKMPEKYQRAMDQYGIKVADAVPADAKFMCSADYKVHSHSELHVVPTYNADLGRYVGSYRCTAHWKAALDETRARFAANPTDDEGAAILQVFVERGVSKDELRGLVAGKDIRGAIPAVLDAVQAGKITLAP